MTPSTDGSARTGVPSSIKLERVPHVASMDVVGTCSGAGAGAGAGAVASLPFDSSPFLAREGEQEHDLEVDEGSNSSTLNATKMLFDTRSSSLSEVKHDAPAPPPAAPPAPAVAVQKSMQAHTVKASSITQTQSMPPSSALTLADAAPAPMVVATPLSAPVLAPAPAPSPAIVSALAPALAPAIPQSVSPKVAAVRRSASPKVAAVRRNAKASKPYNSNNSSLRQKRQLSQPVGDRGRGRNSSGSGIRTKRSNSNSSKSSNSSNSSNSNSSISSYARASKGSNRSRRRTTTTTTTVVTADRQRDSDSE